MSRYAEPCSLLCGCQTYASRKVGSSALCPTAQVSHFPFVPRSVGVEHPKTHAAFAAAEFSGRVCRIVGTSSASFASAHVRKLTHYAVPPRQLEPVTLGFDLVLDHDDRDTKSPCGIRTKLLTSK